MDLHNHGWKEPILSVDKWGCYPYNLSVVHTTSEWDVRLQVDNDGEVEDDETHHQMFVDS